MTTPPPAHGLGTYHPNPLPKDDEEEEKVDFFSTPVCAPSRDVGEL